MKDGDMNTKQGTIVTSQKELCKVAKDYFDVMFAPNICNHTPMLNIIQPYITMEDYLFLMEPITKEEIKQALFQKHHDKSPWPEV